MPSDDMLDLIGRYSTGSLSAEEQKRLFAAAVDDQDLFDQLVREHDLKQLLEEPGVRERMIRALEPPRRKTAWIFGVAATAALSAALMVTLLRPAPKPPPQIADAKIPPPAAVSQPESAPQPVATPTPAPKPAAPPAGGRDESRRAEAAEPKTVTPVSQTSADAPGREALKKEKDQAPAAAPPPPAVARQSSARVQVQAIQPLLSQQQNAPGGPRQNNAEQSRNGVVSGASAKAQDAATAAFGFHYSTETQGHLSIIPAVDGYLFVKSNDGTVLFGPKLSAAGIIVDLALANGVSSVVITFSENSSPVQIKPTVHTEISGSVSGAGSLAAEIKVK